MKVVKQMDVASFDEYNAFNMIEFDVKICSLLPSATEIVCFLGLERLLIGVTHECDFPEFVKVLPHLTNNVINGSDWTSKEINTAVSKSLHNGSSIYNLDTDKLRELKPDIILTQELCDVCAVSYGEVQNAVRVLNSDATIISLEPTDLEGIFNSINQVAILLNQQETSKILIDELKARIIKVQNIATKTSKNSRVLAVEWIDPLFIGGHWVPEMISLAGGIDILGVKGEPSKIYELSEIINMDPEFVIFMPCGFDLQTTVEYVHKEKVLKFIENTSAARMDNLYAVDGSGYFNRPGPRVVDGVEILLQILSQDSVKYPQHDGSWVKI